MQWLILKLEIVFVHKENLICPIVPFYHNLSGYKNRSKIGIAAHGIRAFEKEKLKSGQYFLYTDFLCI